EAAMLVFVEPPFEGADAKGPRSIGPWHSESLFTQRVKLGPKITAGQLLPSDGADNLGAKQGHRLRVVAGPKMGVGHPYLRLRSFCRPHGGSSAISAPCAPDLSGGHVHSFVYAAMGIIDPNHAERASRDSLGPDRAAIRTANARARSRRLASDRGCG